MVLIDQTHQFLQSVLGLETLLLGLSVLVRFLLVHLLLILETVLSLVEANLDGDQVLLHAMDHVLVATLHHHLVLVCVLDSVKSLPGLAQAISFAEDVIFNGRLFILGLL